MQLDKSWKRKLSTSLLNVQCEYEKAPVQLNILQEALTQNTL